MVLMRRSERLALIALGVVLLLATVVLTTTWVDIGDSTCGGLYRPDIWANGGPCTARMALRGVGALALGCLSLAVVSLACAPPHKRRRAVAAPLLVTGVLVLGAAFLLVVVPFSAYRELGPAGRRSSCGSAIRPLSGFENDEVCFDVGQARRRLALLLVAGAVPMVVAGALLVRPRASFRDAAP